MIEAIVCLILLWILVEDVRRFVIRNVFVGALAACFILECLLRDRANLLLSHSLLAAFALVALMGIFALRWIGGGDAKLLAVALLWVGPEGAVVFALALLVCTLVYATGARLSWLPAIRRAGRIMIPMGPSIAVAWILFIGLTFRN